MAICSSLPRYFFFTILLLTITSLKTPALVHGQCLDSQKTLLLEMKRELVFDSFYGVRLLRWNETDDCCGWDGVECDSNDAGRVIGLQLDGQGISGGLNESSSLFHFKYLQKLNMADNLFYEVQIPKAIHRLTYLRHLNLSHAGFSGQVPLELSLLGGLVSLDISCSDWIKDLQLKIPNLEMQIQNLTRLRELHLDGIDISAAGSEWGHTISSSLPHLRILSMVRCNLSGPIHPSLSQLHSLSVIRLDHNELSTTIPDFFANFSSLTTLSLFSCSLSGYFPKMILQIPTLQELDLSYNELLSGTIHQVPLSRALRSIDLSHCNFVGPIPSTVSNLTELIHLDLSHNSLTGLVPSFHMCKKLTDIGLNDNTLMGSLTNSHFEGLSDLVFLYLGSNSLSGSIPHSIFGLLSLEFLDMSINQFSGKIDGFPINISNIVSLDLSHNSVGGSIPRSLFVLPSLQKLDLSDNQFSGKINGFPINVSSAVFELDLSQNSLSGSIPHSLFGLASLRSVDLSNNQFSGHINKIHAVNSTNLWQLDLSTNQLEGPIPDTFFQLQSLDTLILSDNFLNGCLPNLSNYTFSDDETSLGDLDLSNNQIVGDIPNWVWKIGSLSELNLSSNLLENLQKPYPMKVYLWMLDLHSNQLRGELPLLSVFCHYIDYSNNHFDNSITPFLIGNVTSGLSFLSLANNSLSGAIPSSLCNAISLQFLDLSFNNLSSNIPRCLVANMTGSLRLLNLRGNRINGSITTQFSANCSLRTLDLRNNNLVDKIPKSLENCKSLAVMNVGYNGFNDSFPCTLPSSLRVLVLRSNRFYGGLSCGNSSSWPSLQIVDISLNNFSGTLHSLNLSGWRGMMLKNGTHLRPNRTSSSLLGPYSLFGNLYRDEVTLTVKGLEVNLVKIWPDFTSIDLSSNNFHGDIPNAIGNLSSLYLLNLSHNALTGTIPKSSGALTELGSLDLSFNQLRGRIPEELARLTFLSVLDLSYNELVGAIPNGPQFQTFPADSFEGNKGLCGFPLQRNCSRDDDHGNGLTPEKVKDDEKIEWEYVSVALGYGVGLGCIVWILLFCRNFRERYFEKIEEVCQRIFDRRDRRRRRGRVMRRGGGI